MKSIYKPEKPHTRPLVFDTMMAKVMEKTISEDKQFKGKQGTERALLRCELFKARATVKALILAKTNNFRSEQLWEQPTK